MSEQEHEKLWRSGAELEKPPVLFVGSPHRSLEQLTPKLSSRDPAEGKVVFAARDKALAAMFIVPSNDSWVIKARLPDGYHIVISDERRYREADRGGAIYAVPSESFFCDPNKGMGELEWTSRDSVTPLGKWVYSSGVEAMLDLGVQVHFVDKAVFRDLLKLKVQYSKAHSQEEKKAILERGLRMLEGGSPEER